MTPMILSLWAVFVLGTGAAVAAQHPEASERPAVKQAAVSLPLDRPLISITLRHRERLGLSEEQVAALRSLRSDFYKQAIKQEAELRVSDFELGELLGVEPIDLAAVEAKVKQLEGLRAKHRLSRIRTLVKGKALLTPEQRSKLAVLIAEPAEEGLEKHRSPHGRGMEGRMGGRRGRMHEMMRGMRRGMMHGGGGHVME